MIKFNHLWYLLHICCDFAILVNPFFRAVSSHRVIVFLLYRQEYENMEYGEYENMEYENMENTPLDSRM